MTNSLLTDHLWKDCTISDREETRKKQTAEKGCKENADEIQ